MFFNNYAQLSAEIHLKRKWWYHEAVGEHLDAGVAEGGGGEFEVAEVAGEDLGGHGHEVVDEVDDDGRGGEEEEELQLDPGGGSHTVEEGYGVIGENSLKLPMGGGLVL